LGGAFIVVLSQQRSFYASLVKRPDLGVARVSASSRMGSLEQRRVNYQ